MVVDICQVARCSGLELVSARLQSGLNHDRELSDVTVGRMEKFLNSIEAGDRFIRERRISEEVVDILEDWKIANVVLSRLGYCDKRKEKVGEYLSCIGTLYQGRGLSEEQKMSFERFLNELKNYCLEEHRRLMS